MLRNNFTMFHDLITAMNNARRAARDYITEDHWQRMDDADSDDDEELEEEWSVSVTCAHLHPKFGNDGYSENKNNNNNNQPPKRSQKIVVEVVNEKEAQEEEEMDIKYQEFLKRRVIARQSPYPTVVIEVCASPSPDFSSSSSSTTSQQLSLSTAEKGSRGRNGGGGVTAADILKLEQLFGKSAHMNHPTNHITKKQEEEAFYSSIGNSNTRIQELSAISPITMAQTYLMHIDPTIIPSTTAFKESSTTTVDEAYEFIFTNIAMLMERIYIVQKQGNNDKVKRKEKLVS